WPMPCTPMAWLVTHPEPLPVRGPFVAVIGNFDGVHAGHRALVAAGRQVADGLGKPLVALTFEPHPRSILRPGEPFVRLTTAEEKVRLLGAAGVDGVAVLPFTEVVAGWSPALFVEDILAGW